MNLYGEEVTEHMTLRDMEYIAAIAEDKSITRASTRLFVAQPALSQCVQKVEKELGGVWGKGEECKGNVREGK